MVGLKAPVTSLWETQWEGQVCSLLCEHGGKSRAVLDLWWDMSNMVEKVGQFWTCGWKCLTWWGKQDSVGPVVGYVQYGGKIWTVLDLWWEMSKMVG